MFVVFEGPDLSGKSTQIRLLQDWLLSLGNKVVLTREPGGTPGAEDIRSLILTSGHDWDPLTELALFNAARRQHLMNYVIPKLDDGNIVLSDRYILSTLTYQTWKGLDWTEVLNAHEMFCSDLVPNLPRLTFVLDITEETAAERRQTSARKDEVLDHFESKGLELFQHVRKTYLNYHNEADEPNIYNILGFGKCFGETVLIDANGTLDEVHLRIRGAFKKHLITGDE